MMGSLGRGKVAGRRQSDSSKSNPAGSQGPPFVVRRRCNPRKRKAVGHIEHGKNSGYNIKDSRDDSLTNPCVRCGV